MIITKNMFRSALQQQKRVYVHQFQQLTGAESDAIREAVNCCIQGDFTGMHINAKEVANTDLSGVNEIIHAGYQLQQAGKNLLLIYRKESSVEKWVNTTGLDRFITTAILPSA